MRVIICELLWERELEHLENYVFADRTGV